MGKNIPLISHSYMESKNVNATEVERIRGSKIGEVGTEEIADWKVGKKKKNTQNFSLEE